MARGLGLLATLDVGVRPEVAEEPVIFAATHRSMAALFLAAATVSESVTIPVSRAATSAVWSTTGPRDVLMRTACGCMHASSSALIS